MSPRRGNDQRGRQDLLALIAGILVTLAGGCATGPTGALKDGEVRIGKLTVPESVRAGSYTVSFENVEKADPGIVVTQGCFHWSGEGPYCSPVATSSSPERIPVGLVTRNPNTYRLAGYLSYWWKGEIRKSNPVSATLRVTP
jgi:hypothetical protein